MLITVSGCAPATKKDSLTYETKVHQISYTYYDCGELKLKNLDIYLEDLTEHPGSNKNQKINLKNLILLDYKLKEAETIIQCYEKQKKSPK